MLFEDRSRAWRCCTGVLIAAAMGLLVSACGRRGPLEAPPSAAVAPQSRGASTQPQGAAQRPSANERLATSPASVTQDTPDDETDQDPAASVLPTPTPAAPGSRKRGRAYDVPKQPFFLDPLL